MLKMISRFEDKSKDLIQIYFNILQVDKEQKFIQKFIEDLKTIDFQMNLKNNSLLNNEFVDIFFNICNK